MLPCVVLLLPALAAAPAAQPGEVRIRYGLYAPEPPPILAEANLVELRATVRDAQGRPAGGFTAADFELFDNGRPRPIAFFSEQRAGPSAASISSPGTPEPPPEAQRPPAPARSIAVFVDDTHIDEFGLAKGKAAIREFIRGSMLPGDRIAIFTASGRVTLDFTNDRPALLDTLVRLRVQHQRGDRGFTFCPLMTAYDAYAIARHLDSEVKTAKVQEAVTCNCLPPPDPQCIAAQDLYVQNLAETIWHELQYQSTTTLDVLAIAVHSLARSPGERILTMLTPGFPAGGLERRTSTVINAALRARIVINSLDSEGLGVRRGPRQQILAIFPADAATSTGGRMLKNDNDATHAFQELTAAPQVSYMFGFTPEKEPDGTYHRLAVKLKRGAGLSVETRAGYFAAIDEPAESARQRIDRAVLSNDRLSELPATVQATASAGKNGNYTVRVLIAIDVLPLKFSRQSSRQVQELTFATVLEDAGGNYVAGKLAVMDLALTRATLAELRAKGIRATLSFNAKRGSYKVREVVREAVENHLAASDTLVEAR